MAQYNSTEKMEVGMENIELTDVMLGGQDKRMHLYYQIIHSLKKANHVDIIVSFLMESGVKMILAELENALNRGAKVRILTGNIKSFTHHSRNYLKITLL